jgi:predicted nucleic acid-binding protein
MKTLLLDANVLLRFLRDDDPVQAPAARRLLTEARDGKVRVRLTTITLAEVFYALRASYKMPRAECARLLAQVVRTGVCHVESEALMLATLARVETANVDFGDAYLAAEAVLSGAGVASFDTDFARFPEVRWYRPE